MKRECSHSAVAMVSECSFPSPIPGPSRQGWIAELGRGTPPSYFKVLAVSEALPQPAGYLQGGSHTHSLGARSWEVRSEVMRIYFLMETRALETSLWPLLDSKKSSSRKGDAHQKPTLCPQAVLG